MSDDLDELAEPLCTQRLAEIRQRNTENADWPDIDTEGSVTLRSYRNVAGQYYSDVATLLAEHDRQAAEIDRLRAALAAWEEIGRAAQSPDDHVGEIVKQGRRQWPYFCGCAVCMQARALLAQADGGQE